MPARKHMPMAKQAEEALVGAILLAAVSGDSGELVSRLSYLSPSHFAVCGEIWESVLSLPNPDIVSVAEDLRRRGVLDKIGGLDYLRYLLEDTNAVVSQVEVYAQQIVEAYYRRRVMQQAEDIVKKAPVVPFSELLSAVDNFPAAVNVNGLARSVIGFDDAVEEVVRYVESGLDGRSLIPTGYLDLDRMLGGGLVGGGDYLVIGRTGMGKTEFLLNLAIALLQSGYRVLLFEPEMAIEQLMVRLLGIHFQRDTDKYYHNPAGVYSSKKDLGNLRDEMSRLGWQLYINAEPHLTPPVVRSAIKQAQASNKIDVVLLDRGNMLHWPAYAKYGRSVEVTEIANYIKETANICGLPVVETSQVNRQVERQHNKRPSLADIYFGGETAPDVVLGVFRPGLYDQVDKNIFEVLVLKNRLTGNMGTVKLYRDDFGRLSNLAQSTVPLTW